MPCTQPFNVYPPGPGQGKSPVLSRSNSYIGSVMYRLPCGHCMACRLGHAKEWAIRLAHEASMHDQKCFVTLTYNDQSLPEDYSISVRHMQLFMKLARKRLGKLRYFLCGEYGDRNQRPHYHALLFGTDFYSDRYAWRTTSSGYLSYRSPSLEALWPYGNTELGSVTTESAGYVARYMVKKVNGPSAKEHYTRIHPISGQICHVTPEFITMSTKPGIGASWYDKYKSDAFPSDFVTIDGHKYPVPRYYRKKLPDFDALGTFNNPALGIDAKRSMAALKNPGEQTRERLATKDLSQELKASRLRRELDEES